MSKLVYLYVTPFFPSPTNWRGAYCYDLVQALARTRTYEVRVFKPGDGSSYEYHGVTVHTFRTRQLPSNVLPFLFAGSNARSFVGAVEEVAEREGWSWDDVAVCHGNTANFCPFPVAAKRQNPKCLTLLHHHDPGSFGLQSGVLRHCWPYNLIQFPIFRSWHEQIDGHVFISELVKSNFLSAPRTKNWMCESYRKQMRWLPWRSVQIKTSYVLYNGVDTAVFKAGNQATKRASTLTIGCVGNFSHEKGQLTLLKAVKLLASKGFAVQVRFVGSGGNIEDCRRFAASNGLNVRFLTEVDHGALPDFYRGLDLFVLPSAWDGFGCVYTEALACGTPFITTSGAGVAELIREEDRKCWVWADGRIETLAQMIECFHSNRMTQRLNSPIEIDDLVRGFVRWLTDSTTRANGF